MTTKHITAFFLALLALTAAHAAQNPPLGAWQTTNQCFLVGFLLNNDGRALAAYMTGETDSNAAWTWDGSTLTITSHVFDLDKFTGRVVSGGIEADYVWHNNDTNQLNRQSCAFQRVTPSQR
ncbi:MAG TPA: hypothetical protein VFW28_07730 [Micropepsaceae bacterium]|nr:hypothetical protein [Micropepsaceae bacterium]